MAFPFQSQILKYSIVRCDNNVFAVVARLHGSSVFGAIIVIDGEAGWFTWEFWGSF